MLSVNVDAHRLDNLFSKIRNTIKKRCDIFLYGKFPKRMIFSLFFVYVVSILVLVLSVIDGKFKNQSTNKVTTAHFIYSTNEKIRTEYLTLLTKAYQLHLINQLMNSDITLKGSSVYISKESPYHINLELILDSFEYKQGIENLLTATKSEFIKKTKNKDIFIISNLVKSEIVNSKVPLLILFMLSIIFLPILGMLIFSRLGRNIYSVHDAIELFETNYIFETNFQNEVNMSFFRVDWQLLELAISEKNKGCSSVYYIVSNEPFEGKTTIAEGLILRLSNSMNVGYIDADYYRKELTNRIEKRRELQSSENLNDLYQMQNVWEISYDDKNTENDSISTVNELNQDVAELVEKNRQKYDVIIVDTAPLAISFKQLVLSNKSDKTLLVIQENTNKNKVSSLLRTLNIFMSEPEIVVINKVINEKVDSFANYYFNKHI